MADPNSPNTPLPSFKKSNIDADIAGIGGGTLSIIISQYFSPDSEIYNWIIYSAPTVSIVVSLFWRWAKKRLDQYFKIRRFKRLIKRTIIFINKSLEDPLLSDERKNYLKQLYDQLNIRLEKLHLGQIDAITFEKEYTTFFGELGQLENNDSDEK